MWSLNICPTDESLLKESRQLEQPADTRGVWIPSTSHRSPAVTPDQQTSRAYHHHHHHHHVGIAGWRGSLLSSVMQVGRLIRHMDTCMTYLHMLITCCWSTNDEATGVLPHRMITQIIRLLSCYNTPDTAVTYRWLTVFSPGCVIMIKRRVFILFSMCVQTVYVACRMWWPQHG